MDIQLCVGAKGPERWFARIRNVSSTKERIKCERGFECVLEYNETTTFRARSSEQLVATAALSFPVYTRSTGNAQAPRIVRKTGRFSFASGGAMQKVHQMADVAGRAALGAAIFESVSVATVELLHSHGASVLCPDGSGMSPQSLISATSSQLPSADFGQYLANNIDMSDLSSFSDAISGTDFGVW